MEIVATGMPARTRAAPRTRVWLAVSVLLIALFAAAALVPFWPRQPLPGLDGAWMLGINAAVAQGLVFGRDLIFTFGPYGALYTFQYNPGTDALSLGGSGLLVAAITAGLVSLTPVRGRWWAVLLALFLSQITMPPDGIFFIFPLLFLAVVVRRVPAGHDGGIAPATALALVLLAAALALLPLVKGTFGAGSAIGMGAGLLVLALGRRWGWMAGLAVLFAAAMPAFWMLAGQPLPALPMFFAKQKLIIAGYTEAMSLWGSYRAPGAYCLSAALILLLHLPRARRSGWADMVLLAGAAFTLLLGFKAGFVRHDSHAAIAASTLVLAAWVLMLSVPPVRGTQGAALRGLAIGLVMWVAIGRDAGTVSAHEIAERASAAYANVVHGLAVRLGDPARLGRDYAGSLAGIRALYPLPKLSGPTDVYSVDQSVAIAYGLPWAPRPVLQSYSAYTPQLERINANHLKGAAAPENVLFKLEPIDGRLPSMEDGPSWPLLLSRYKATALLPDGMAVLRRRDHPDTAPMLGQPILAGRYRLGTEVALPDGQGPLWARIDLRTNLLGRLAELVYKPTPLLIELRLADGTQTAFRFVPGMGRAGFLISPLVWDATQFLSLAIPWQDKFYIIRSIRLIAPGHGHLLWQRSFTLELRPMRVPVQPAVRRMVFASVEPVTAAAASPAGQAGTTQCRLELLDGRVTDRGGALPVSGPVHISGWGFIRAPDGIEPDSVRLVLVGRDGREFGGKLALEPRPDIAAHLHKPKLVRIGFHGRLDLGTLSGQYDLRLDMVARGHSWSCPLHPRITVTPDPP